jgi:hypothetical protein
MAQKFIKPRLLLFNNNPVTDHNRSPLEVTPERIEKSLRTANGSLRKYWVADKHTFDVSWDMLPASTAKTVDGYWGADAIENFWKTTPGAWTLAVTLNTGQTQTYTVHFADFNRSLQKRFDESYWNVTASMEEI